MKKSFLIIFLFGWLSKTSFAQVIQKDLAVKSFEIELAVGGSYGLGKYVGTNRIGPALALEGRYNFKAFPADLGLELFFGSTLRSFQNRDLSNRIASVSILGDYNFYRGQTFSPFVGFGIGMASCDVVVGTFGEEGGRFLCTPRVGVEICRHFRLTCYSRLCVHMKGYNQVGFSLGYVLGGGLKR